MKKQYLDVKIIINNDTIHAEMNGDKQEIINKLVEVFVGHKTIEQIVFTAIGESLFLYSAGVDTVEKLRDYQKRMEGYKKEEALKKN